MQHQEQLEEGHKLRARLGRGRGRQNGF
jgi:hypothetical protein